MCSFIYASRVFGIELSKSLSELFSSAWNYISSYTDNLKEKRRLQSRTGWVMLHEKVKFEEIKKYLCCKKNIYHRKFIHLNRWWWNEL